MPYKKGERLHLSTDEIENDVGSRPLTDEFFHSNLPGFQKEVKQTFILSRRFEKGVKGFDVKVVLDILKKNRLFADSLKTNLVLLYDLLKESWELMETVHVKRAQLQIPDEEMRKILDNTEKIISLRKHIEEDLIDGQNEMDEMYTKLRFLAAQAEKIIKLVKEMKDDLSKPQKRALSTLGTSMENVATEITGIFHIVQQVFTVIYQAYEKESLEITELLDDEIDKLDKFFIADMAAIKAGRAPEPQQIDFKLVFQKIAFVQRGMDRIIENAEKEQKLAKYIKDVEYSNRLSEILEKLMHHPELPTLIHELEERNRNLLAAHSKIRQQAQ
jgi:hypothetical protein